MGQKTTELDRETTIDGEDLVQFVEVADTTMAGSGTNKRIKWTDLLTSIFSSLFLDEDDMATDSATKGATQQSVKAYVGTELLALPRVDGWLEYDTVTPTLTSTTDGVDTIKFNTVNVAGDIQVGNWCKATSSAGTNLPYKVKSVTVSTSGGLHTNVKLVGEVSISGTITSIFFSRAYSPQGAQPWEKLLHARAVNNGAQTGVVDATLTTINLGTEKFDYNGDFASNAYTIPVTGAYIIIARATMFSNGKKIAGYYLNTRLNGTSNLESELVAMTGGNDGYYVPNKYTLTAELKRGDVLTIATNTDTSDSSTSTVFDASLEVQFNHV